jgi:hypothetical protein
MGVRPNSCLKGGKAAGSRSHRRGPSPAAPALLQQGEGVAHAHLGQQLAKAAPLGGQLARRRRGSWRSAVRPLQGVSGARLHPR